jgi:hypothetical protein
MQQVSNNKDKSKKELQNVKIGFLKQGKTLTRFCNENGINHSHAFRVFMGTWKGEKAQQLRQRLIDASKGKTDFQQPKE